MSHLTAKASQYKSAFDLTSLSDLALWFDFSDISSQDLSDNFFVGKVVDKSGNNRNGYVSNALGGYYYFDRVNRGIWGSPSGFCAIDLSDISLSAARFEASMFFVVTPYVQGLTYIVSGTDTLQGNSLAIFGQGGNVQYRSLLNNGTAVNAGQFPPRKRSLLTLINDPLTLGNLVATNSNTKLFVNGFLHQSYASLSNRWTLCNTSYRFGDYISNYNACTHILHEALIFSNAVTDTTRCSVEEYLRKKWFQSDLDSGTLSPTDVSGCILWVDVCDTTTVTIDSGGGVTRWADKSGRGNDASGTTQARNPTWDAARGGLYFGGSRFLFTGAPGPTNEETGFAVIELLANTTSRFRLFHTSNLSGREVSYYFGGEFMFGANGITNRSPSHYNNQKYVISWRVDPSSGSAVARESMFAVDGVVEEREFNAPYFFPPSPGVTTLGTRNTSVTTSFTGNMYEACLYNKRLSDTEFVKINNYLLDKWKLGRTTQSNTTQNPGATSIISMTQDWPFSNQPAFQRPMYIPYDINNLGAWYDAADRSTFELSGTSIRVWRDKSGWQNDLSACVGGDLAYKALPTYLSNTQEVDISGGFFRLRNLNISTNQNLCNRPRATSFSLFMVFKPNQLAGTDVSGSAHSLFNMRSGTSNRFIHMPTVVGPAPNFSNRFLTYTLPATGMPTSIDIGTLSTSNYNILGAVCGHGRYVVTNNGSITADLSGSPGLGTGQFDGNTVTNIGRTTTAAEYYAGKVKEIIFFNRPIGDNEREEVEYYLAKKWDLTSLLPSNHPMFTRKTALVSDGFSPRSVGVGGACAFWVDAAQFNGSNYSHGDSISSWSDKSMYNSPVDISGTLTYSASYGVPGVNMCNGVALSTLTSAAAFTSQVGTAFVVASLDSLSPGIPGYCMTITPGISSNILRNTFVRSDTSLSIAILGSGTSVSFNISCNTTTAGTPFIWETSWTGNAQMFVLCNGVFPTKTAGYNNIGISGTRVFLGCDASAANIPSWRGNIHEVLIYKQILGDWERYGIRGYLAQKWKISNALPLGSPYKLVAP